MRLVDAFAPLVRIVFVFKSAAFESHDVLLPVHEARHALRRAASFAESPSVREAIVPRRANRCRIGWLPSSTALAIYAMLRSLDAARARSSSSASSTVQSA